MQENIHPGYKKVKFKFEKDSLSTGSTYKGEEIILDIDFRRHPAWNKSERLTANVTNQSISAFNKKFAGLNFKL